MHRNDPHRQSDDRFLAGALRHLVPGNCGRLLDPRRTPVRIAAVREARGEFDVEILDFEDRGVQWTMPLDAVSRFQFEPAGATAPEAVVARLEAAAARVAQPLRIDVEPDCAARTLSQLEGERRRVAGWLDAAAATSDAVDELASVLARPSGGPVAPCPATAHLLLAWMDETGTAEVESAFAARWVSNPGSGELVKGHRIVIAEDLGLAAFAGTVVRDPGLFDPPFDRARRAAHVLARLAFLSALLPRAGCRRLTVYRGACLDGPPEPRRGLTFVAGSLDVEVAWSCFAPRALDRDGLLVRRQVPVERVFMTSLETVQLNRQYRESEVVLLADDAQVSGATNGGMPLF